MSEKYPYIDNSFLKALTFYNFNIPANFHISLIKYTDGKKIWTWILLLKYSLLRLTNQHHPHEPPKKIFFECPLNPLVAQYKISNPRKTKMPYMILQYDWETIQIYGFEAILEISWTLSFLCLTFTIYFLSLNDTKYFWIETLVIDIDKVILVTKGWQHPLKRTLTNVE